LFIVCRHSLHGTTRLWQDHGGTAQCRHEVVARSTWDGGSGNQVSRVGQRLVIAGTAHGTVWDGRIRREVDKESHYLIPDHEHERCSERRVRTATSACERRSKISGTTSANRSQTCRRNGEVLLSPLGGRF